MEDAVTLHNVTKTYQDFELKDISFSIKKGFITGFLGQNGAGKTTTMKLMLQLLKPDRGKITIFGEEASDKVDIKQRIGFVYSEHHLYEHLTVEKMKRVIAPFYENWDDEIFAYYMERLKLPWKQKIGQLSRGMGTKLSIAIALSHHAELLILDEPTSGLDPISRREILEMLAEVIQDEEKTVFFSTHITSDLEQIADYIVLIHDGKIILNNDKETMMEEHGIVRGAKELLDQDIRRLFLQVRETGVGFEGLTNQVEEVRRIMGEHVVLERATLEDIMVYTAGNFRGVV